MDLRASMKGLMIYFLLSVGVYAGPAKPGPNHHLFVHVPAGSYQLGSDKHRLNRLHVFKTGGFFIADAETTNAQFAAFVTATGYRTRAERNGWSLSGGEGSAEWEWKHQDGANWRHPFGPAGPDASRLPDHPVTQICGEDARAYCRWLGGRLPHFDEWETAARAEVKTRYPWGENFRPKRANTWNGKDHRRNTGEDGFTLTAPVRSYPPNAWGLYDVIGNVFEYCEGRPPWLTVAQASRRICGRGGSWWCSSHCCDFHNLLDSGSMIATASLPNQGFRVVLNRPPAPAPP